MFASKFAANFLFDEHGLASYFSCDPQGKARGISQRVTVVHVGEMWPVHLYYQT